MSDTLERVKTLVAEGAVRVSSHGYDELANDDIFAADVVAGCAAGVVVEDYPEAVRGPSVLVLQRDPHGKPIHAVWGIPKGATGPAVLITAYRPDPERWTDSFMQRKKA